jgi:hypothetical protein
MGRVALTLNLLAVAAWLGIVVELVRRPPPLPRSLDRRARRAIWVVGAVAAFLTGTFGLPLGTTTTSAAPRDAEAGPPADELRTFLRTPFAIVERSVALDGRGRSIHDERRETLQLPVVLLAFLAGMLWYRSKSGGRIGDVRGPEESAGVVGCLALLACSTLLGCGAPTDRPTGEDLPRPQRVVLDVSWDTLALVRSSIADTLLYSVWSPAAGEDGFFVVDPYGARVARFAWDGSLLGYIGRRGGGPGEFGNVRDLDVDDSGTLWTLDVENVRVSGFDRDGALVEEVPLSGLPLSPPSFAANHDGSAFYFVVSDEELVPWTVERSGRATGGPAIAVDDAEGAFSMALQGYVARTDTDGGWLYAFSMGDGYFPMRGVEREGPRVRYPELVPFPGIQRSVTVDGNTTTTTTGLTERRESAISVDTHDGVLYLVFAGESEDAGRLLERYDLATGSYIDSVRLPRPGYVAVWEDRIVLVANNPEPEALVLRAPW